MNEIHRPDGTSDAPWPTSAPIVHVPDPATPPLGEGAPPPAVRLLNQAVHGAHDTLDRLANAATPAVQQLGESLSTAGEAVQVKADQARATRDQWADSMRTTVRGNPLTCITAALALGMLISRLMGRGR